MSVTVSIWRNSCSFMNVDDMCPKPLSFLALLENCHKLSRSFRAVYCIIVHTKAFLSKSLWSYNLWYLLAYGISKADFVFLLCLWVLGIFPIRIQLYILGSIDLKKLLCLSYCFFFPQDFIVVLWNLVDANFSSQ